MPVFVFSTLQSSVLCGVNFQLPSEKCRLWEELRSSLLERGGWRAAGSTLSVASSPHWADPGCCLLCRSHPTAVVGASHFCSSLGGWDATWHEESVESKRGPSALLLVLLLSLFCFLVVLPTISLRYAGSQLQSNLAILTWMGRKKLRSTWEVHSPEACSIKTET